MNLDPPGGDFWKGWMRFVTDDLLGRGYITETDLSLIKLTDDVEEAVGELESFYRNFDSMRFVGDRLSLRLKKAPDERKLQELSSEFADIIVSGSIERTEPSKAERQDDDALDAERIWFVFDRASYGRLRQLIDRLNEI